MVYENVEKIRIAKGVTKTFLANKIELSLQGYRHITSGNTRLDVERLKIIAGVLGVEPAVFFDKELTEIVIRELQCMKIRPTNNNTPPMTLAAGD